MRCMYTSRIASSSGDASAGGGVVVAGAVVAVGSVVVVAIVGSSPRTRNVSSTRSPSSVVA